METAITLFAFGTIWFWALVLVASIIILGAIEHDRGFLAFFSFVAVVAALFVWGDREVFVWMKNHPWKTVGWVGVYFAAGTFWFITKWWRFVRRNRHAYDRAFGFFKEDFNKPNYRSYREVHGYRGSQHEEAEAEFASFKARKVSEPDVVFKEEWTLHIEQGSYHGVCFEYRPKYRDHKNRIFLWACYWPWSAFWTLLSDPIKKIWDGIIYAIRGLLERISASSFRDVDEFDPEKAKEKERLKMRSNGRCDLGHDIVHRSERELEDCRDCFSYIEANPKILEHIKDEDARATMKSLLS